MAQARVKFKLTRSLSLCPYWVQIPEQQGRGLWGSVGKCVHGTMVISYSLALKTQRTLILSMFREVFVREWGQKAHFLSIQSISDANTTTKVGKIKNGALWEDFGTVTPPPTLLLGAIRLHLPFLFRSSLWRWCEMNTRSRYAAEEVFGETRLASDTAVVTVRRALTAKLPAQEAFWGKPSTLKSSGL